MSDGQTASQKRPWIAAALAVIIPGLGHVYARAWVRALLWFILFVSSVQFLVPDDVVSDSLSVGVFAELSRSDPSVAFFLIAVSAMNVIDAYLTVSRMNYRRQQQASSQQRKCPNCRKELDEDLEFCHWCTTRLETEN